ncbi:hypothetical protein ACFYUY_01755 [Kitasatospora sp. NPDC004745]|uniref:hypothetical protein n=1 Tax=Kitasatospora sp. NPDC004745 TaxID=3364019 RepID=UPI00368AB9FD
MQEANMFGCKIFLETNAVAFPVANKHETMTRMTSYEPDPSAAKTFASYKKAYEAERDLKPRMKEVAEGAIRTGASNQELAALTGLTPEYFRKLAAAIGVDNRRRAPTVGREVEAARKAAETAQ